MQLQQTGGPGAWHLRRLKRGTREVRGIADLPSRFVPPAEEAEVRGCGLLALRTHRQEPKWRVEEIDLHSGATLRTRELPARWKDKGALQASPSGRRFAMVAGALAEPKVLEVDDRPIHAFKQLHDYAFGWIDDETILVRDGIELTVRDATTGGARGCWPGCPASRPTVPLRAAEIDAIQAGPYPPDVRLVNCFLWTSPYRSFKSDLSPLIVHHDGGPSDSLRKPIGWRFRCADAVYVAPDGRRFRMIYGDNDRNGGSEGRQWGPLVAEGDVRDEVPTPDAFLGGARSLLAIGALDEAEQTLQYGTEGGAWSGSPRSLTYADSPELWALRAVIASARGDEALAARSRQEVERLRGAGARAVLAPAANPTALPAPALAPGDVAYVAATRLRLRAKPSATGSPVGYLPIAARVEVVGVDGEWARLRGTGMPVGPDHWTLGRGGPLQASANAPGPSELEGWSPRELLSLKAPAAAGLLDEAAAAETRGAWADVQRALERAGTIDPPSASLLTRVTRAAALRGDFEAAAQWAVAGRQLVVEGTAHARVAARFVLGCRGDRTRATRVYPGPVTDRFECGGEGAPPGSALATACPAPAELASAFPANACVVGVPPPCGHCADMVRAAVGAGAARHVAGDANVQWLLGLFRDGPWIEAEVMVPGTPFASDQRLFAVVNGVEVLEPGVGWPAPGRPRTVWIPAGKAITGGWHSVGFVSARSAREAREKAQGSADMKKRTGIGSLETFRFDCRCVLPPGWSPEEPIY